MGGVHRKAPDSWSHLPPYRAHSPGLPPDLLLPQPGFARPFHGNWRSLAFRMCSKPPAGSSLTSGLSSCFRLLAGLEHTTSHLHVIVSSGGATADGRWRDVNYIPFEILHRKWQYHLLEFLKRSLPRSEELRKNIDKGWSNYPEGFVANVQKGKVPGGGKGTGQIPRQIRRVSPHIRPARRDV